MPLPNQPFTTTDMTNCPFQLFELYKNGVRYEPVPLSSCVKFDSATGKLSYSGNPGKEEQLTIKVKTNAPILFESEQFAVNVTVDCLVNLNVPALNTQYSEFVLDPASLTTTVIADKVDFTTANPSQCPINTFELLKDGVPFTSSQCLNFNMLDGQTFYAGVPCKEENL